jgi:hypothetical protein
MFKIFLKYLLSMTVAAALGFIGVHYVIYGVAPWSRDANVSLSVSIRGTQNQAVPNAQIFMYAPTKKYIGNTNAEGNFEGLIKARRGRIAVVEAVGPTFQIRRDVPIPKRPTHKAVVRLDAKEAALGNMSLLSKSIEDMSKSLSQKPLTNTAPVVQNTAATNAQGGIPEAKTNPSTSANTSKSPQMEIKIEVSDERARPEHRISEATTLVRDSVAVLKEKLLAANIRTVRLRPLTAEDSFFEILGFTQHGAYVSSMLIKCSLLNQELVSSALAGLTRPFAKAVEGKALRIYTSEPDKARAYINGAPLPRTVQTNYAEFKIIEAKTPNNRIAIAATADGRPLIRKIARPDVLLKLVEWHMPEPALSRR